MVIVAEGTRGGTEAGLTFSWIGVTLEGGFHAFHSQSFGGFSEFAPERFNICSPVRLARAILHGTEPVPDHLRQQRDDFF